MTDDELQDLYNLGMCHEDPKYLICIKAWQHIEQLEEERCDRAEYIAILKQSLKECYG